MGAAADQREREMSNDVFKVNRPGVRALLRSEMVLREMERRARAVAAVAGPGHVVDSSIGRNRARAAVITTTGAAIRAEAKDRNLTRAINAARD